MLFSITSSPRSDLKVQVENFFKSGSALAKDPESNTKGTIILGRVVSGKLEVGASVQLILGEKIIIDTVVRIEIDGCKKDSAMQADVGICLQNTTIQQLAKDFGLQPVYL